MLVIRLTRLAITLPLLLVLVALSGSAAPSRAQTVDDLTFAGPAESTGTVSFTLTADRTGLVRASLQGVIVPIWCPGGPPPPPGVPTEATAERELYYDPPRPLTDGAFEVWLPLNLAGSLRASVRVQGNIASDDTLTGTATWALNGEPVACGVTWGAAGPIETSPQPSDAIFAGPIEGGAGDITVVMDEGRATVKAVVLAGVALPPCTTSDNPLDVHVALGEPGTALVAGTFEIEALVSYDGPLRVARVDGRLVDDDHLEGTLTLFGVPLGGCDLAVLWTAQLPQPATATPTPTSAVAAPPTATSTASAAAAALPSAGQGNRAGSSPWLLAALATVGAAIAGFAFASTLRR
jgi:hypothetical protein